MIPLTQHPGSVGKTAVTNECVRLGLRCKSPSSPLLHSPSVRRQELAPNRERGAYESLAWLPWLRRACPSATLDKQSRIQLSVRLYHQIGTFGDLVIW